MASLRQLVVDRAAGRCEYCRIPQGLASLPHTLDHIVAQQHHGPTEETNLCFACAECNAHKGPNLSGIDPTTKLAVRLFHPRLDPWAAHFRWRGPLLEGLTDIGRATIDVLAINDIERVAIRRLAIQAELFDEASS
jgi:HNH endonuclease